MIFRGYIDYKKIFVENFKKGRNNMLGIVIANWNGEKILTDCLDSLMKQSYNNFKVYIIDNASKDKSLEIINSYMQKISIELRVMNHNTGFAIANNIGIQMAIDDGCENILTLNNDVELDPYCLENAMKLINKNLNIDIFQLLMINFYDRKKCDAAGLIFNKRLYVTQVGYKQPVTEILNKNIVIEGACAGAAIYRSSALQRVQLENGDYFDSNFFAYYEDVDLALRLRNTGSKALLAKDCIVYHIHSATGNKTSGFKEYYLARNLFLYMKRNQDLRSYKINQFSYYKHIIRILLKNYKSLSIQKSVVAGVKDAHKNLNNY